MSSNHYSKSHIEQVAKMIFPILIAVAIGLAIADIFGPNSFITEIFFKKIVFTPYNIVGVILFVFFLGGTWVGRGKAKILFCAASVLTALPTLIKIYNFFNSDLASKIFDFIAISLVVDVCLLIIIPVVILIAVRIQESNEKKKTKNKFYEKQPPTLNSEEIMKHISTNTEKNNSQHNKENAKYLLNSNNLKQSNRSFQDTEYCSHNIVIDKGDWKIANKRCPECGAKLVSRTNGFDGTYFLGCANYGRTGCDFTINYHEYHLIRERMKVSK